MGTEETILRYMSLVSGTHSTLDKCLGMGVVLAEVFIIPECRPVPPSRVVTLTTGGVIRQALRP